MKKLGEIQRGNNRRNKGGRSDRERRNEEKKLQKGNERRNEEGRDEGGREEGRKEGLEWDIRIATHHADPGRSRQAEWQTAGWQLAEWQTRRVEAGKVADRQGGKQNARVDRQLQAWWQ